VAAPASPHRAALLFYAVTRRGIHRIRTAHRRVGRRARRTGTAVTAVLTVVLTAISGIALAAPASAVPPVYEINGHWVNPPDTVASGNPLVGEWRVNVNDSANPPSNDPVDNVVATFTVGKGIFNEIPDMCRTAGVDPVSSISADGSTLTCNFGTVKMGTALVLQTPIVAQGITGDEVSLSGTSPSGEDVDLQRIPI